MTMRGTAMSSAPAASRGTVNRRETGVYVTISPSGNITKMNFNTASSTARGRTHFGMASPRLPLDGANTYLYIGSMGSVTRLTYPTALVLLAVGRGLRFGFDIID